MNTRAGSGFNITLIALVFGMAATHAFALTFDVDTEVDGPDNIPGDGICATLVGPCTLRAAIEEANALGGAHTINLPQGFYHAGDHVVTSDITLLGPSGISAHDRPRVIGGGPTFTIEAGALLSITDVGILFGDNADGPGCFENDGELEITNGSLSACTGTSAGAIFNGGTLTMTRCEVEDSVVVFPGFGGGVFNSGTASLTNVAFRRNESQFDGGAIYNTGQLSIVDGWLDENVCTGFGGGLTHSGGSADLTRVTMSRNTASGFGGGIFSSGDLNLTNATIHSNTSGTTGGGLYLEFSTYNLVNVTLYDNSNSLSTGDLATVKVVNTIFFDPTNNCVLVSPLNSLGHNLEHATNSCGLNGTGDLVGATVLTGEPGLYGGFGETVPLLPGSPGIDDGDTALAPPTDQNGVLRWDGDGDGTVTADIGAYEYGPFFADGFESGNTSRWSATVP